MSSTQTNGSRRRQSSPPESLPPSDLDAERSLLGSVLIDPDCFHSLAGSVRESDFYAYQHQVIFRHIAELSAANRPIDVQVVASRMAILPTAADNDLKTCGGLDYLAEIINSVPTAANALHYAETVLECSRLRRLLAACQDAQLAATKASPHEKTSARLAAQLAGILDSERVGSSPTLAEVLAGVVSEVERQIAEPGRRVGVSTGLADFDAATGGLLPGQLIVLAARPSMGKSALAAQWAEAAARRGRPVLFCSLEMSALEIGQRMLCSDSGASMFRVHSGKANEIDLSLLRQSAEVLSSLPLSIEDKPGQSVASITSAARRVLSQHGSLGLVVVDYLQLISPDDDRLRRDEQVGRMTRQLKAAARVLGCPVVVLAQLNRAVEKEKGNRPALSHLRESGAIEQDADCVVFVHREEYYRPGAPEVRGQGELIIAKQRNGPCTSVRVAWQAESLTFFDLRPPTDGGWGAGREAAAGEF